MYQKSWGNPLISEVAKQKSQVLCGLELGVTVGAEGNISRELWDLWSRPRSQAMLTI